MPQDPWNHNIHYHRIVLGAAPDRVDRALDVGCGEGLLTAELSRVAGAAIGLDRDADSIRLARTRFPDGPTFVSGDLFDHGFPPQSFDLVASVATLHHVDAAAGLARMAALLRPGGVLAVVGLARADRPLDHARGIAAAACHRPYLAITRRRYWEHSAPTVWPPPESYTSMRTIVADQLPGARFRRHLFWRYSVVWTKPSG